MNHGLAPAREATGARAAVVDASKPFQALWAAALVMVAGLAAAALIASACDSGNKARLAQALETRARQAIDTATARMMGFERGLRGARGAVLMGGLQHISAETFRIYAESRDLAAEVPGLRGLGFVQRLGEHDVLQLIAPLAGNSELIGLDIAADAALREAADAAMRSGQVTMAVPRATSGASAQCAQCFLALLPVYFPGVPLSNRALREDATIGWTFVAIDRERALSGINVGEDLELDISDATVPAARTPFFMLGHLESSPSAELPRAQLLELYGRKWSITARAGSRFAARLHPTSSGWVFAIGAIFSMLASALAATLTSLARRSGQEAAETLLRSRQQGLEREIDERKLQLDRAKHDLRAITDAFPSMVGYWDKNLINRFANHAYGKWFAVDPQAMSGMRMQDLLAAELLECNRPHIEAVLRGEAVTFELDLPAKKDSTVAHVTAHCIPDTVDGKVLGFYVMVHDITDRRLAADALRITSERLALATGAAGQGIWEWDFTSNTLHWDEQMYRLYGRTRQAGEELYALWVECLHPADRARIKQVIKRARRGVAKFDTEFRVVWPGGETRYLKAIAQVVRDPAGAPLRLGGLNADVTERKEAELALAASEARFRSLFELSPVGFALNDMQSGQFLHLNAALAGPTGYSREELLCMTYWDLTPESYQAAEDAQIESLEQADRYGPYEKEYQRKDGTTYPVLLSGIRTRDAAGRAVIWSIVQDISQRKAMESQLAEAARRDKLTGLANRVLFMERLEAAVARVRSGEQPYFAVLFLDFDRFKLVNDTLGHEAGDELLRQIALRLRGDLRASDTLNEDLAGNVVSRFGGDEFLLLINNLKEPGGAIRIAERLLNALAPAYDILGSEVHSSASIGIVTSAQCLTSAEEVVRNADVAMYEAKRAGRGCSVVFNEAMHTRLARHVMIETSLRRAIDTAELHLVYQPIVELATGRVVSAEALLRWNHPTLGAIAPSEFIPIAEESSLIVALGQWVQREACQALVRWRAQDPQRAPRMISVNVSRAELALGSQLLEQLRDTLERVGLPAQCLQLEVTEREVMRNPEASLRLMHELQDLGVKLAMDDFGTGTSSLGFLRNYPFNTIKIDRSFVQDLAGSRDVLAVIHATINLVENLGMESLAEGVEEPSQIAILQSLGCRFAQGYFFSPPVPAERFLEAMATGRHAAAAAEIPARQSVR